MGDMGTMEINSLTVPRLFEMITMGGGVYGDTEWHYLYWL